MRRAMAAIALLLGGCPAGKSTAPPRRDAGDAGAVVEAASDAATAPSPAGGTGRISVTVVWPTAPAAVRASPGYTTCHTARPARAQIGTLHGVTGAFVVVTDLPAGKTVATASGPRRLTVRDCAIAPLASEARGTALEVQTQDVAHAVLVERIGVPWLDDDGTLAPVELARAQLPILGHTVGIALDAPGAIRVTADGATDDAAWVLAPPHAHAGITDEVGALGLGDIPAGSHTIVAWLPPRAGQPAQRATATVTVVAGDTVDAKLTFSP